MKILTKIRERIFFFIYKHWGEHMCKFCCYPAQYFQYQKEITQLQEYITGYKAGSHFIIMKNEKVITNLEEEIETLQEKIFYLDEIQCDLLAKIDELKRQLKEENHQELWARIRELKKTIKNMKAGIQESEYLQ